MTLEVVTAEDDEDTDVVEAVGVTVDRSVPVPETGG